MSLQPIEIPMRFKYEGGIAAQGKLDIYDAAVALRGISRAVAITTHAFLHHGEIRTRAERVRGAKIYLEPPVAGSFDQLVKILIDQSSLGHEIAVGVAASALWDVTKTIWSKTVGVSFEPSTPTGRMLSQRIEPRIGDLEGVLEPAIKDMHRPIQSEPDEVRLNIVRPRVGVVLLFNESTLEYLSAPSDNDHEISVSGNVTRYNIISGHGRFYDDEQQKTIAFQVINELNKRNRELITWSLDARNRGEEGKLEMDVLPARGRRGEVLRYVVRRVRKLT